MPVVGMHDQHLSEVDCTFSSPVDDARSNEVHSTVPSAQARRPSCARNSNADQSLRLSQYSDKGNVTYLLNIPRRVTCVVMHFERSRSHIRIRCSSKASPFVGQRIARDRKVPGVSKTNLITPPPKGDFETQIPHRAPVMELSHERYATGSSFSTWLHLYQGVLAAPSRPGAKAPRQRAGRRPKTARAAGPGEGQRPVCQHGRPPVRAGRCVTLPKGQRWSQRIDRPDPSATEVTR